jgi:hypothetical protein
VQVDEQLGELEEEEEEEEEPVSWTRVDYAIFSVKCLMWLVVQVASIQIGFGAVFFATSVFAGIWLNLGNEKKKPGRKSAYSVFNPGFETINGTFDAQQFEAQIGRQRRPPVQ